MKIIDCVQGAEEWKHARIGIPTASAFDNIITPKTRKASGSQAKYLARLAAEWFVDEPIDHGTSGFMERGKDMEKEAVKWYNAVYDADAVAVGFATTDDGKIGCSPDRLVGDDGGAEIKCPAAHTHLGYWLNNSLLVDEYHCQVQGCLWVCERQWWDIVSYNPVIPPVVVRIARDEGFIGALATLTREFVGKLDDIKSKLAPFRPTPKPRPKPVVRDPDPFGTEANRPIPQDTLDLNRLANT